MGLAEEFIEKQKVIPFVAARGDSVVVEGNQRQRTWSCMLEEDA